MTMFLLKPVKPTPGRVFSVLGALLLIGGCALPGYDLNDHGANSPWYQSDPRAEQAIEYEPEFTRITPDTVLEMQAGEQQSPPPKIAGSNKPQQYKVGPGDVLNVIVFNHPELTNPAGTDEASASSGRLVSANGVVFFPFVGEINVDGLTIDQIRRKLSRGLSRVIRDPQIDVRVAQYRSQQVFITGDIPQPCSVPISDLPLTILKAFDACESLAGSDGAVGIQSVSLVRDGERHPIDLNAMYRSGNLVYLRDGDRLVVDDSASRVFIVGEFNNQVAAPLSAGGITLADAIAAGGGIRLDSADPGSIFVIRGFVAETQSADGGVRTLRKPHVFHLDASSVDSLILADQFPLQPRDVVYAAPASFVSFNRALGQLTPTLDVLFRSYLLYDRGRD